MSNRVRGFTLIEVMVAVAVIGLAATALFSLFSTSLFNIGRIKDLHRLQLSAEEVMNRVLLLPALPAAAEAQGNMTGSEARWLVQVTPWIPRDLGSKPETAVMKVDVEIQWKGRSGQQTMKLETVKLSTIVYENNDFQHAIETIFPN